MVGARVAAPFVTHRPLAGGLIAALLGLVLLRLGVAAGTDVVEDEAYYWLWSRHLAAGYYDHPPGVAWMIAASERIFGATSLGVRGAGVLAGGLLTALVLPLSPRPGLLLLLLGGLPLYTLGGVLATPDLPLLFGWTLALFAAARGGRWWWLAGIGGGIAGLGKYTGWGLWPLLFAFYAHQRWRDAAEPREWGRLLAAFGLSLLIWAPNLWWNAEHDWVSVLFQLGHGLGGAGATSKTAPGLGGVLAFVGAQIGLVSPVLFGAMLVWAWQARPRWSRSEAPRVEDRIVWLAWWTSAPVLVFFTLAASLARAEPNWAAPAWVGACLGLSTVAGPRLLRAAWVGGWFAAILSALVLVHLVVPIVAVRGDPTARLGVGRTLAASVEAWGIEPVYTTRYQEAAILQYYEGLDARALPGVDRTDQFDLWPARWAEQALYVRPWRGGNSATIDPFCDWRSGANDVAERNADGSLIDRWQVYEVRDCHAKLPTKAD